MEKFRIELRIHNRISSVLRAKTILQRISKIRKNRRKKFLAEVSKNLATCRSKNNFVGSSK